MYPTIGAGVHAAVLLASSAPSLSTSPPTCAHVMPRHAYVSSNAALTAGHEGYAPESYWPNLRLMLIAAAASGLQWCTSGSTAAEKVAPSAAFFWLRSDGTSPILYLCGREAAGGSGVAEAERAESGAAKHERTGG